MKNANINFAQNIPVASGFFIGLNRTFATEIPSLYGKECEWIPPIANYEALSVGTVVYGVERNYNLYRVLGTCDAVLVHPNIKDGEEEFGYDEVELVENYFLA